VNILLIDPDMKLNVGNVGLGYLSSILLAKGHRVQVMGDCEKGLDEIDQWIKDLDADLIGFSVRSNDTRKITALAAGIKKKQEALLICGGAQITVDGISFFEKNPCFDIGVIGEGEETLIDIVDYVQGKMDLKDIKGIIAKDGDKLFQTEKREFIKDLDKLPFPDYSVFDIYSEEIRIYGLITSRGCPYGCIYCNGSTVMGKTWRYRTTENVVQEMIQAKKRYKNIGCVNIYDDNFTLDLKRAKEICRALIDHKLDLEWRLPNGIRGDKVDDELAALMRMLGFKIVRIGIESASPEIFQLINKRETLDEIERGTKILKKHGIKVIGSFIIGLPNSSYLKDMESLKFAKKLKLGAAQFHVFGPFKKTKSYDMAYRQKGVRILRTEDEVPIQYYTPTPLFYFDTEDYPEKERIKVMIKGNLRFDHYEFTRDFSKSPYSPKRFFILVKLIILYDPVFLPIHIIRLTSKFFFSIGRRLFGGI